MIHPVAYEPSQDFGDNPTRNLPASHWIIQQFGNYQPEGHTGVDYPCPVGTQVKAAADGVVLHVGYMAGGYADNPWWIAPGFAGYVYVVDHGHFIGIYGHCMDGAAKVKAGGRVVEGQVLGLSGNTGASTGPHLHFEVLPDGYNLYGPMYGRINPASLFGGIQVQGTTTSITPVQEDDMFSESDRAALARIDAKVDPLPTGDYWRDMINAMARVDLRTWEAPGKQYWSDLINAMARVDASAATGADPQALAAAIAEALPKSDAEALVDALASRLGGK